MICIAAVAMMIGSGEVNTRVMEAAQQKATDWLVAAQLQEALVGSKEQLAGNLQEVAAAWVIGKMHSSSSVWLFNELEQPAKGGDDIIERSQSIVDEDDDGRPKMVLMMVSQ
jgi:hypothetical protein